MFAIINTLGILATLAVFLTLAARRYPGLSERIGFTSVLAIAVMIVLWPVALWVGVGLWLRGYDTPRLGLDQYRQLRAQHQDALTYARFASAARDVPAAAYWRGEADRVLREMSKW